MNSPTFWEYAYLFSGGELDDKIDDKYEAAANGQLA